MKISNELLAAYAEGKVTKEERNQVRQYLAENPQELESVMMMMDEDYELSVDDNIGNMGHVDASNDSFPKMAAKVAKKSSFSDLCYSAAAFAPKINPIVNRMTGSESTTKESFGKRLDDFMDELGI